MPEKRSRGNEAERDKLDKIAREILELSRNKLLVNMRFLDIAISRLEICPKPELTHSTAADGGVYVYDPKHIITSYRISENLPVRNFLHSILHCVFKHMFVGLSIDRKLWDIACDIAVESVINDLDLSHLRDVKTEGQLKFLNGFKAESNEPTAERVYRFLTEKKLDSAMLNKIAALFMGDDHNIWYMSGEEKAKSGIPGYDNDAERGGSLRYVNFDPAADWSDIAERMAVDIKMFKLMGTEAGSLTQNLKEVTRERYDYTEFLKKFAVRGEAMKVDPDEFDYNFYTYGLELYEDMPLIEPLEYKEVKRVRDFVIVIDTSGSVSGELVQTFIQKTYNILKSTDSFFSKIDLHIIQCDAAIQSDVKITSQEEFDDYIKNMKLEGFGGTDFRPAFSYVNSLVDSGEFTDLKGLIYFTDGCGVYPARKPPYDAAFVFIDNEYNDYEVPAWAIKLVLSKEDI